MVSDDKVAVALSDAVQVARDAMDDADSMVSQRENEVKATEQRVADALKSMEEAEDVASKAAGIYEVLEFAEQKVNDLLIEK